MDTDDYSAGRSRAPWPLAFANLVLFVDSGSGKLFSYLGI